jgi:hypothetical protein
VPTGDPRDRDSAEFARAAAVAASRGERACVLVLGSSLGANNGGGLKWLKHVPSVETVVVVDPHVPDTDRAEWKGDDSVFARLSTTCAMTGSLQVGAGTCVANFLVVRSTADAFAVRDSGAFFFFFFPSARRSASAQVALAAELGLADLVAAARRRADASKILENRALPDVLVGGRNDHGFTARVRAAFAPPAP